jgi:hypothetical protein
MTQQKMQTQKFHHRMFLFHHPARLNSALSLLGLQKHKGSSRRTNNVHTTEAKTFKRPPVRNCCISIQPHSVQLTAHEHRPREPTSVSTILEPLKSTKSAFFQRHTLISRSHRRIHIADQQQSELAEPGSRRHGKGPSHMEPQPRPQSASGSRDFSTRHEDEVRATPDETYSDEPEQLAPTIITSSSKSEEEWEGFARLIKLPDGTSKWQCHWRTMDDGVEINCGYMSKKQLVRRHIETTHLKYRRVPLRGFS